jgi:sugar lactone lactonase YvrE
MKNWFLSVLLAAVILMAACARPVARVGDSLPVVPGFAAEQKVTSPGHVPPIAGRIDFGPAERATQANMAEVGSGATVSLIDTTTGYTVVTTVSTPQGEFLLNFASNFIPPAGKVYFLEAVKGLKAGTSMPNRVGADLARVRTLIWFRTGFWESVSAGQVILNSTSTALSILLSLRSLTPSAAGRQIDPTTLMGIMQPVSGTNSSPSPYTYANSGLLPGELVRGAYLLVLNALAQDKDPFQNVSLDTNDPLYNTLLNAAAVQTVAAMQPDTQFVGSDITLVGAGFSTTAADNVVEFSNVSGGPVKAVVKSVEAGGTRLTVTVPPGAVTGTVAVTLAGRKTLGPTFYLALKTGHEALDSAGNLYVANEAFGTIVTLGQDGAVRTFFSGLDSPRNLVVRSGKLYVTCAGSKGGVVSIDLAAPSGGAANYGVPGAIGDPRGIAFDDTGRLYVSDGAAAKIWRIDGSAAAPVALGLAAGALNNPHGLAFALDGKLFVANTGANTVLKVDVSAPSAAVFLDGFSTPWGVAFDSNGNLYVSNNAGNSVYRWDAATSTVRAYADMPSPGGIVADRGGYVYAIDNKSNNVYRITPEGDSAIFASGISSPTGIVKIGNVLYVLSQTNNALMKVDTTTSALSMVARGFNAPFGLAYDATRDLFYVSNVGNGSISKVERATGRVTTVLVGTGTGYSGAWGIAYRAGRLYLRAGRKVMAYDVTNFSAVPLEYESLMQDNMGIAGDASGGPSNGTYYVVAGYKPDGIARIFKVLGDGGNWGSVGASNRVAIFTDSSRDANLSNPRDVAVDSAGRVWVVNTGNSKVTSYKPDGTTHVAAITNGVSNPQGINQDGANIWIANYDARTITGYSTANGSLVGTISTGSDRPYNLVVSGTTMYVTTDNGIARVTSYNSSPAYSLIYTALKSYSDIEVDGSGNLYVLNGAGRRVQADLSTDTDWYRNYHSPRFFWQGGGNFWVSDRIRFTHTGMGNWGFRLIGVTDWFSGPSHAAVDSAGNIYLNGTSICSADAVNRLKPGAQQEEWTYQVWSPNGCWIPNTGSLTADSNGKVYVTRLNRAEVLVIDASGNSAWLPGGQPSNFMSYGSWVEPDGSQLYQTIQSHHRVERVDTSNGNRTVLPYGLSSAEM